MVTLPGSLASKFALGVLATFLTTGIASAEEFHYASQGDPRTLDPHAMNEQLTLMIQHQIYDPLIGRDQDLNLVPSIATSWEPVSDTVWRLAIREGVTFHQGQPLTAHDVAFSINRARPGHQFAGYLASITDVAVIDDYTVEVTTGAADPLLPAKLSVVLIMDQEWAEANDAVEVSDIQETEENYAVRNANGTGPYVLVEREVGVRTVLERNEDWWDENQGNVTRAVYTQIQSAPTRVAALLSGEVDLIIDAPLQDLPRLESDPNITIEQGLELRTMLLGLDQARAPSPHIFDNDGNPLDVNPFQDLRVRQAFAHAIDVDAILERVLRGYGVPAGTVSIPGIGGYQEDLDVRPAADIALAEQLMADAGFADGFQVSLLCPNNRYINDTEVCRAIASFLSQIDVTVTVDSVERNVYFQRLLDLDTSFYIIGLTTGQLDTQDLLYSNLLTREPPAGQVNFGLYSNPDLDAAVQALAVELDPDTRTALYREALTIARDDVADIRLYHQPLVWAMRSNIDAHLRSDNYVMLRWVTVN